MANQTGSFWLHRLRIVAIASATILTGGWGSSAALAALVDSAPSEPIADAAHSVANDRLTQPFCADAMATAMDDIVSRPQFDTANWGVLITALDADEPLYAHNADQLLIPASNIKLLTTAAAIRTILEQAPDLLGDFQDDLNLVNRNSNNARADQLLRGMGGQSRVRALLAPLGVSPDGFIQADGSGLSRDNQAKPSTFVTLLKGMYATEGGELFYESLPVGGVNGTLRNRFKGTAVQGKVRAKTGTLRGVRALSGYLETEQADKLTFSIVVNQSGQSGRVMLSAIDEMVLTMARLDACD